MLIALGTYIVQKLRSSVSLDVVGIKVTPPQLNVDPEPVARCPIQDILDLHREFKKIACLRGNGLTSGTSDGRVMFH